MAERVTLTDPLVQSLPPAAKGKRYVIYDAMLEGLAVRVTDTGAAAFYTARRWPGGSKHPTGKSLGSVRDMTVAQARAKLLQWNELFKKGIDPTAEERRARREAERARRAEEERERNTFGSVLKAFCRDKQAQRQIERVRKDTERECRGWAKRAVSEITRRDVIELVKGIKDRGAPTQAHNTFGNLQRIFNWAVDNDIIEASPLAGLRPKSLIGTKTLRQRVLSDAEIIAFWKGCETLPYPYREMFRLLLLTGQRKVEVWKAKWGEFDLDAKLWTIPEERFKSGSVHRVPLSDDAVAILTSCPRFKGGDYVFTAKNGSTYCNQIDRSRADLDATMAEALGTPLPRWTLHDLRRTMRTRLSSLRIPTEIAEMCIGHGKKGLERIYNQHTYADEMREAMDAWAARLRSIVDPPPANVVALRG
jgi:integrase